MSWAATGWAAKQQVGTPTGKLVLLVLSQYAGQDTGALYWGQHKLMEECELGEDTLRERLKDLEELGLIARFKQERDSGGYTVDMIVVLHDEGAQNFADWLFENSELKERRGQTFRTVSLSLAKAEYDERAQRSREASRRNRDGGLPGKTGNRSGPVSGTYPGTGREPKKRSLNHISKSCAEAPSTAGDLGETASGLASKEDEALRQACLAASVPGSDHVRVFVDYGSDAFRAWTKTYRELGLVGPSWGKRMVPNGNDAGCGYSRRDGSYFPSEWPPGCELPAAATKSVGRPP